MSDIKAGKIYRRKYVRRKEFYFVTHIVKEKHINGVDIKIYCYNMERPDVQLDFYQHNIKLHWCEIKNVGQIRD